jgi:hydrogenase maturation protein HypF
MAADVVGPHLGSRSIEPHTAIDVDSSGRVFRVAPLQNRILLEGLARALRADGLTVYTHHQVPANDGGLSLGQAVIAAHRPAGD